MNSKVINIILALLIFLPTCAYVPLELYLVLIGMTVFMNRDFLKDYFVSLFKLKIKDENLTY